MSTMTALDAPELRERMQVLAGELAEAARELPEPTAFMEVCGTHTVSACRTGVHALMPDEVKLVSGPGCPVCVTSQGDIDALVALASREDVTLTTYPDMMPVVGREGSLEQARSRGADVRTVTSTTDTATGADRTIVVDSDTAAAPCTQTLPDPADVPEQTFVIVRKGATHDVTVDAAAGNFYTVGGSQAALVLDGDGKAVEVQSDGASLYYVVGGALFGLPAS